MAQVIVPTAKALGNQLCCLHQALWAAGYYAALGEGGVDAFAADVTAVLENVKAAAKRSGLEVATRLGERKAADVAELALGTLRSLLDEHRSKQGAAGKGPKGKHGDKAVSHWGPCFSSVVYACACIPRVLLQFEAAKGDSGCTQGGSQEGP